MDGPLNKCVDNPLSYHFQFTPSEVFICCKLVSCYSGSPNSERTIPNYAKIRAQGSFDFGQRLDCFGMKNYIKRSRLFWILALFIAYNTNQSRLLEYQISSEFKRLLYLDKKTKNNTVDVRNPNFQFGKLNEV